MTHTFNTPIGAVRITEEGGSIIRIELTDAAAPSSAPTPLLREAEHQITAFLRGERRQLDLPIRMVGTALQQRVWRALQQIPYGATRTYGEIAPAPSRSASNCATPSMPRPQPTATWVASLRW